MNFRSFGFRDEIQGSLDAVGYETPTPIQAQAIPVLMEGRDVIGIAQTGTGKTLAFLLPMFQQMKLGEPGAGGGPQGLVICPTRELAIQVAGEAERFGAALGVKTVLAYGGTSSAEQKRLLGEGCDLVVGTPGRLLDFVNSAWLSTRNVRFVVLDEADRMLDMGFITDVDAILKRVPMSRQTALFSATFPDAIKNLSLRYMLEPATVQVDTTVRIAEGVDHAFYPVRSDQKVDLLLELLRRNRPGKTLIFTATREGTSELATILRRKRYEVISLSSLLSQSNRERALASFREGSTPMLVATDVAARGIDIDDIDLVVNFDPPMQAEDYVHRIGRTGRAKRSGVAITLLGERDEERADEIDALLPDPVPRVEVDGFPYRERKVERRRGRGRGGRPGGGGGRGRGGGGGRGRGGGGGAQRKRGGGSGSGSGRPRGRGGRGRGSGGGEG